MASPPNSGNVENFKKGVAAIDLELGDSFNKEDLISSILKMKFGDLKKVIEGFKNVESNVDQVSQEIAKINPDAESAQGAKNDEKKNSENNEEENASSEDSEGGSPLVKASKAILKNEGVKTDGLKDNAVVSKAAQVINKKFGKNAWNIVKFYAKKKLIK